MNKVYHPNIDEVSGTVCLDVINQAWTALYDLSNIFESFLPQLLTYPNPIDPLNGDAAAMYLHKPEEYKKKVADYVRKYATEEALRDQENGGTGNGMSSDSESSMSDFSEDEAQDMELAAHQRPIATSSSAAGKRSNLLHKRPHANDVETTEPLAKTARLWNHPGRMSANETLNMFQATSTSCLELCASGGQSADETQATGLSSPCVHPLEVNVDLVDPGGYGSDAI
ncbi:UBE2H enzyme, partial [Pseudoatta argentina]